MSKTLRVLGLVALAACTMMAPCAPALAYSAGCQMAPCEGGSSAGIVRSSDCCCAAPGTASDASTGAASLQAAARVAPSDAPIPESPAPLDGRHAERASLAPASSCYI